MSAAPRGPLGSHLALAVASMAIALAMVEIGLRIAG